MSDLVLSDKEQAALRFVLAAEPLAGHPLPPPDVLERLAALVRCDSIGAAVTDQHGYIVEQVELRHGHGRRGDGRACDGPLRIGVVHWTRVPGEAAHAALRRAVGLAGRRVPSRPGRRRAAVVGPTHRGVLPT